MGPANHRWLELNDRDPSSIKRLLDDIWTYAPLPAWTFSDEMMAQQTESVRCRDRSTTAIFDPKIVGNE